MSGEEIVETPVAQVAPARRIVTRAKDILAAADDRLLAVKLLGWRSHTFQNESEPTKLAILGFVDVSGSEPVEIGVADASWTRVVKLFQIVPPDQWQVGHLRRNPDAGDAIELVPPDEGVDLDAIARMLGPLQLAAPTAQLALPAAEQLAIDEVVEAEVLADDDPDW